LYPSVNPTAEGKVKQPKIDNFEVGKPHSKIGTMKITPVGPSDKKGDPRRLNHRTHSIPNSIKRFTDNRLLEGQKQGETSYPKLTFFPSREGKSEIKRAR
jgi:hypothetical protein